MPVLKALKRFTYNKVKLREGDLFKCKGKDVAELREEAGAKGIFLPSGYIPKAELIRIIAEG
jgi:hypothetical protein